jgi:diacylglycerol kinase (ATP)
MKRYCLIVNPTAGRGAGEQAVPRIERILDRLGAEYDLMCTESRWHAVELAHRAASSSAYDVIVAVGGDGTFNEVLNGLMRVRQEGGESPAVGVLSVGRGNDFAFGVGIPHGLEAGCRTLVEGYRRRIDIGRVEGGLFPQGRYFGNGAGVGFDAVVGFEAQKLKRLHGFSGYLVAALKTIFLYYRAPNIRIEHDGQTIEQCSLMISTMNGPRLGGGFMMAPQAELDDGLLDLCIARKVGRVRVLLLIPRFMRGTQAGQPAIRMARARRVVITALNGVLPAHADGETICTDGERLSLEVLPHQIEVVCPPPVA